MHTPSARLYARLAGRQSGRPAVGNFHRYMFTMFNEIVVTTSYQSISVGPSLLQTMLWTCINYFVSIPTIRYLMI